MAKEVYQMKRLIFGCTLMLSGILGGSAWMISHAILKGKGAWKGIVYMLLFPGLRGSFDGVMVLVFYLIAIVGAVIAIKEILRDK